MTDDRLSLSAGDPAASDPADPGVSAAEATEALDAMSSAASAPQAASARQTASAQQAASAVSAAAMPTPDWEAEAKEAQRRLDDLRAYYALSVRYLVGAAGSTAPLSDKASAKAPEGDPAAASGGGNTDEDKEARFHALRSAGLSAQEAFFALHGNLLANLPASRPAGDPAAALTAAGSKAHLIPSAPKAYARGEAMSREDFRLARELLGEDYSAEAIESLWRRVKD